MTDTKALLELAARCEAATGADRELDAAVRLLLQHNIKVVIDWMPGYTPPSTLAYTGSLDAAMTLRPDGWTVGHLAGPFDRSMGGIGSICILERIEPYVRAEGTAATPALALCAASLRAIAQEQDNA